MSSTMLHTANTTKAVDLNIFSGISLAEMSGKSLMKRIDKKYVIPYNILPGLLPRLVEDYYIQEISEKRVFEYATLYYDTPQYEMYHLHQCGKLRRLKIRTREYIDSNLCFLEIKRKSNKGITKKIRIKNEKLDYIQKEDSLDFIAGNTPYTIRKIEPKLNTYYQRITLVNKNEPERVTIDFDLSFKNVSTGKRVYLPNITIIEIKRERFSDSPVEKQLSEFRIKPRGMSKYCLGTALTEQKVKINAMKPKILYLNKLTPIVYE